MELRERASVGGGLLRSTGLAVCSCTLGIFFSFATVVVHLAYPPDWMFCLFVRNISRFVFAFLLPRGTARIFNKGRRNEEIVVLLLRLGAVVADKSAWLEYLAERFTAISQLLEQKGWRQACRST